MPALLTAEDCRYQTVPFTEQAPMRRGQVVVEVQSWETDDTSLTHYLAVMNKDARDFDGLINLQEVLGSSME